VRLVEEDERAEYECSYRKDENGEIPHGPLL
jgi:hypothetical protein